MFTGTRFVLLAPLLVPSYVLALQVETVTSKGKGVICLFPLTKELLPVHLVGYLYASWVAAFFNSFSNGIKTISLFVGILVSLLGFRDIVRIMLLFLEKCKFCEIETQS